MKIIILLLGIGVFWTSCRVLDIKQKELTLERIDYLGNELRLDGYYYTDFIKGNGLPAIKIYFLYRNGIILYGSVLSSETAVDLEDEFRNGVYAERAKDDRVVWGVFQVDGTNFKFERWYPSSGGPAPVAIKAGKIKNDTTFYIVEEYKIEGGSKVDVYEVDNIYHFKPFTPKPDSTNIFIK